jgi:chemotaxis family two-component system response regulator Rcp1
VNGTIPTMRRTTGTAPILLVEDNQADVRLTREAIATLGMDIDLAVVTDGDAALAYLRSEPPYDAAPRPVLVLLDLNLPRVDGKQVLAEIKDDPELRTIPVIILTTSAAAPDVDLAYQRHANCYIVKPLTFADFGRAMERIGAFWLDLVALPQS